MGEEDREGRLQGEIRAGGRNVVEAAGAQDAAARDAKSERHALVTQCHWGRAHRATPE